MTVEEQPPPDPFANLNEAERAQVEQAVALERAMNQHVFLPLQYNFVPIEIPNQGPGIVMQTRTPAGSQSVVLTRETALAMASALRKVAQTGPSFVPGLAVPG